MINKEVKSLFGFLIAGSRGFDNYPELERIADHLLSQVKDKYNIVVLEGQARGADLLGKRYAQERGYKVSPFPANWDLYGKSAGFWRNEVMVSDLSVYPHRAALFFWDGESRGTKHCILQVKKRGIPYKIWNYVEKKFVTIEN